MASKLPLRQVEFVEDADEEAEATLTADQASTAVVYATDWTTETILTQFERGNIDLNPRFQRRDAWTLPRKSRFIESLILGLPIPQIVLAEIKEDRGRYLVLDGKQRLLSLLQFTGKATGKNNSFKLAELDVRGDLNGKTFEELKGEPALQGDFNQFTNQPIRTVVIRNWPNIDFLYLVFVRLNTGSVPLSPQELRQASFPGPFVDFLDDAACDSPGLKTLLGSNAPDFRMRDTELLLRYLAFSRSISTYSGNLKDFLDTTCKTLNSDWANRQEELRKQVETFEAAADAAIKIFGRERVARKYTKAGFEPRLNRAVLDIMLFYFSDSRIRSSAIKNRRSVLRAFEELCTTDEQFRSSLETTTKSLDATITRFKVWGLTLKRLQRSKFEVPVARDGRIRFSGFWKKG